MGTSVRPLASDVAQTSHRRVAIIRGGISSLAAKRCRGSVRRVGRSSVTMSPGTDDDHRPRLACSTHVDYRLTLRMLAVRDQSFFTAIEGDEAANVAASGLTPKEATLVRIAAMVVLDAAPACYAHVMEMAGAAGVTPEEAVGAMVAAIPATGGDRAVSAASKLGLALDYDVDTELKVDRH